MRRHPPILNVDIAGAAVALAIAAGAVFLLLRPGFDRSHRIADLNTQHASTLTKLARAELRRKAVQDRMEAARATLARWNGGLPRAHNLDTGIKQVVALATETEMQVDGIRPVAHRKGSHWDEYQFEIKATGRYPAFHRFCRALEARADFVDVPSYAIEHHGSPGTTETSVTCAVRFYALPDSP